MSTSSSFSSSQSFDVAIPSLRRALSLPSNSGVSVSCCVGAATLFEYSVKSNGWDKRDVEGAAYMVQVVDEQGTRFFLVILNKLSTKNFQEPITNSLLIESSDRYIMYRNAQGRVMGIWVFDDEERQRLIDSIQSSIKLLEELKRRPNAVVSSGSSQVMASPQKGMREIGSAPSDPQQPPSTGGVNPAELLQRKLSAQGPQNGGAGLPPQGPPIPQFPQQWTPSAAAPPPMVLTRQAVSEAIIALGHNEQFVGMMHSMLVQTMMRGPGNPGAGHAPHAVFQAPPPHLMGAMSFPQAPGPQGPFPPGRQ